MRAFDLVTARDSRHALALLAEHGASAKILAGGTDLLVELKSASHTPQVIVDISRAEDMKSIAITGEGLSIGALVTHTEIMRSPLICGMFPALVDAAHTIGAVQTRNLGTLGGNLVTGVPSMDSGPTLLALDALVTVAGPAGRRQMPLGEFFVAPRKTALQPAELLAEIVIPRQNLGKPAQFLKFGLRKGQALALVNVAASLWVDWDTNVFVAPPAASSAWRRARAIPTKRCDRLCTLTASRYAVHVVASAFRDGFFTHDTSSKRTGRARVYSGARWCNGTNTDACRNRTARIRLT